MYHAVIKKRNFRVLIPESIGECRLNVIKRQRGTPSGVIGWIAEGAGLYLPSEPAPFSRLSELWRRGGPLSLRLRSREESGHHDGKHQVQEPHPGENRWDSCPWFQPSCALTKAVTPSCLCPRASLRIPAPAPPLHPSSLMANRG